MVAKSTIQKLKTKHSLELWRILIRKNNDINIEEF